jgi:aminopeptidase N
VKRKACVAALASLLPAAVAAAPSAVAVVHYDLRLGLDLDAGTVEGEVEVTARGRGAGSDSVVLDAGELTIDAVRAGRRPLAFAVKAQRLEIRLPAVLAADRAERITIAYRGQPRRGLRFVKERRQAYTVFSTSHWMPAVDAPDQKATLRLRLSVPAGLASVGPGERGAARAAPGGRVEHEFRLREPLPTYVFGFAVGPFRSVALTHAGVRLEHWATGHSDDELRRVFVETGSMLDFFEERAGVRYPGKVYTQVLAAGRVEQEVGNFALLGEDYGRRLLADPRDLRLFAHELAHQWWGNGVTCVDWTHFWLNEGMATFMAAAYRERRLGRDTYLADIDEARGDYERVRDKGGDKALVFEDWLSPSGDDRTIVYRKGAYVLHLLREHLGDAHFWEGLRTYTRRHMGGSVTTRDLQEAMEETSRRDLADFFGRWVYGARARL